MINANSRAWSSREASIACAIRARSLSLNRSVVCARTAAQSDPRDLVDPELQEIGFAQTLQLDGVAERHHAPSLDGASADAGARRRADEQAAGRRQTKRKRRKDNHCAARIFGPDLQEEQNADHGELADRQRHRDSGQIRNGRQQSLKSVESSHAGRQDEQSGGDQPDADRSVEGGELVLSCNTGSRSLPRRWRTASTPASSAAAIGGSA